jgi:hypothetical protein
VRVIALSASLLEDVVGGAEIGTVVIVKEVIEDVMLAKEKMVALRESLRRHCE